MSYTLEVSIDGRESAPRLITAADDGKIFVLETQGDQPDDIVWFKFSPALPAGITVGFMLVDNLATKVRAADGEAIQLGETGSAVGGTASVRAAAKGDVLILTSDGAGTWVTISRITAAHWTIV